MNCYFPFFGFASILYLSFKLFFLSKDAPLTKAYSLPVGARSDIKFPSDKKAPHSAKELHMSFKNIGSIPNICAEDESKIEPATLDKHKTPPPAPSDSAQKMLSADRVHKDSASLRTGAERSLSDTAAVIWDLHHGGKMSTKSKENMTTSEVKINELPRTSSFKASPLRNM